jgi:protein-S-isoprenylcysteine O-methyltransferase Ste14
MLTAIKPLLKTVLFTVFVPGTVAGYVPWILRRGISSTTGTAFWLGLAITAVGVAIYLHTALWGFALHGRGTPAPIAPTQTLVVVGLHRYVRNPMYIGVLLAILGQAILFRSLHILLYAAIFCVIVHCFVLFYEEPTLRRQFGDDYAAYVARVPRWFPRLPPRV